jgi:aqualysin 1
MMNAKYLCVIGLTIAFAALSNIPAFAQEVDGSADGQAPFSKMHRLRGAIPKQYIVVFRNEITKEEVRQIAKELKIRRRRILQEYTNVLNGFAIRLTEEEAKLLSQDERVEYVQEDGLYTVNQVTLQPCRTSAADGHVPKCVSQQGTSWNLNRLNQGSNNQTGSNYTITGTGKGVDVYVLDTGIRTTHKDFQGRATSVFNAINDGNGSSDCNGHGTFVAGLIGGSVYGTAKEVNLKSVRVLDCSGNGSSSSIIAGIDWVTTHATRPSVVNISFGGAANSMIDDAVKNAAKQNFIYVVAAGNENVDAKQTSPARVKEAITVGAIDRNGNRAGFSNYGDSIDFYAPGVDVYSSFKNSDSGQALGSGTSMAAPMIAGIAAIQLEWTGDVKEAVKSLKKQIEYALGKTVGAPDSYSPSTVPPVNPTDTNRGDFKTFGTPFIY